MQNNPMETEKHCCSDCGEKQKEPLDCQNTNGEDICEECVQSYVECFECSEVEHEHYTHAVNGENVCEGCFHDNYFTCYACGGTDHVDESYSSPDGDSYCRYCFDDNYAYCDHCQETIHRADTHWTEEDECLCSLCYEEDGGSGAINCYSYRPRFEYKKEKWEVNNRYLGIELEVEGDCSTAGVVKDDFESLCYFKSDSSIDGFEIVSHPCTVAWLKNNFSWRDRLKQLQKNQMTSYRGGSAGLHIHVNRQTTKQTTWWKIALFMGTLQDKLFKFSQRTQDQIDDWARLHTKRDIENNGRCKRTDIPKQSGRYNALNFTDYDTVEFRLFRGTLHFGRFWSTVLFVDSLVSFAEAHGYGFFKLSTKEELWTTYIAYLKNNGEYQFLHEYLKSKNLYRQRTYTKAHGRKEVKLYY